MALIHMAYSHIIQHGFPTDTFLPIQPCSKNTTLVSMRNRELKCGNKLQSASRKMRGILDDNRIVAFKRLDGILQGEAEFWMMNLKIMQRQMSTAIEWKASGFHLDEAQENEFNHLVQWVRQRVEQEGLKGVADPILNHEFDYEKLERLIGVAYCA
ncbi:hypothetical protein RJ639_033768, partial [Escallonia herrerae]